MPYMIQHVDSHESRNGIQSDQWRTQTMRRNKREGPRKRNTISILGTGTADTIEIEVAPEPSRYIFVSRLHSDINSNKLTNYLKSKNIVTRNVEYISHPDSKSRSFKLSVPKSMFKTVFDATLWPEGISAKKYYSRYIYIFIHTQSTHFNIHCHTIIQSIKTKEARRSFSAYNI